MEELFNPITILLHLFNATLLFVAVRWLVYKPVRNFLKAREDKIEHQLHEAKLAGEEVGIALQKRDELLRTADHEVMAKMTDGQRRLHEQEESVISAANAQAQQIIERAKQEAGSIMDGAREAMQAQIAQLGMEIAQKILEREIRGDDHEQMIADFLKKVG